MLWGLHAEVGWLRENLTEEVNSEWRHEELREGRCGYLGEEHSRQRYNCTRQKHCEFISTDFLSFIPVHMLFSITHLLFSIIVPCRVPSKHCYTLSLFCLL